MTPEQTAELRQKKYNATVARLTRAHSDLMMLRVRPDFPLPPHQPGQYTSLGLGFWIMFGCTLVAFIAGLLFPKVERSAQPPPGIPAGAEEVMGHMS